MDLELVATSAVAAGIVSAVVNALFGWLRFIADVRDRRQDVRREHLRIAVSDFLSLEAQVFDSFALIRSAAGLIEELDQALDAATAGKRTAAIADSTEQLSLLNDSLERANQSLDGTAEARKAMARIRLYSRTLHLKAQAVLGEYNVEKREEALTAFLDSARRDLGIDVF